MKKLLFILTMIMCPFLCVGQTSTLAEEKDNSFVPLSEIDRKGNNFFFTVPEAYEGEFEENPIKFMEKYFDVHGLLERLGKEDIDGFYVTFMDSRGTLNAQFDEKGELQYNFHKCKNVLVPMSVRHEIYKNHKGWTMVKNVHIAKGKKDKIDEEFYRIKMKKGNSTKRTKIFNYESKGSSLSSIH